MNLPLRKRLPAYGARLRDLIRTGVLPLCVHLIYGFDWKAPNECVWHQLSTLPGPHPLLAVKPSDYMLGALDFSVVTGLKVCVFDQDGVAGDGHRRDVADAAPAVKALFVLLGEIAAFAAEVEVYSPAYGELRFSAHELAAWQARPDWPFWWSADIEEKHGKRRAIWYAALYERAEARILERV